MDYRDRLKTVIDAECNAQGLTRWAWCRMHGFPISTLSLILAKKRHASGEYAMALAQALGCRLSIEKIEGAEPTFVVGPTPGRPKIHERVTYPRRPKGRPRGRKDSAPRKQRSLPI